MLQSCKMGGHRLRSSLSGDGNLVSSLSATVYVEICSMCPVSLDITWPDALSREECYYQIKMLARKNVTWNSPTNVKTLVWCLFLWLGRRTLNIDGRFLRYYFSCVSSICNLITSIFYRDGQLYIPIRRNQFAHSKFTVASRKQLYASMCAQLSVEKSGVPKIGLAPKFGASFF